MDDRASRRAFLLGTLAAGLTGIAGVEAEAKPLTVPVFGNAGGDVTVGFFLDYQCPYCKSAFREIQAAISRDGRARLVFKDWPVLGSSSREAARLVLATARQGRYANSAEALLAARRRLAPRVTAMLLERAGVDVERAKRDLRADPGAVEAVLRRNAAQASSLGLRGTPGLLVGSTLYHGGLSRSDLVKAIELERAT